MHTWVLKLSQYFHSRLQSEPESDELGTVLEELSHGNAVDIPDEIFSNPSEEFDCVTGNGCNRNPAVNTAIITEFAR